MYVLRICSFRAGIWKTTIFVNLQSFDPNDNLSLVVHLMETGVGVGRGAIIDASPRQQ